MTEKQNEFTYKAVSSLINRVIGARHYFINSTFISNNENNNNRNNTNYASLLKTFLCMSISLFNTICSPEQPHRI